MRSALGVRFLALLVAAAALLPACKKEGDTIILSAAAPPKLPKGAFVAGADGRIYFVTPEGFVRTFHDFSSGNQIWGLAWDGRAKVLYSAVWGSVGQGVIYRHKLDGSLSVYASKLPGTNNPLQAGPLAISPADGKLYSGTNDGFIIRWDGPENGAQIHDAGNGREITGLAFNSSGEVFYSSLRKVVFDILDDEVRRRTGDTTYETWLPSPGAELRGLSFAPSGTLFVAATKVGKIVRIDGPGVYSDYFTGLSWPFDIDIDEAGNYWVAFGPSNQLGILRVFDPNRQPLLPDPLWTSAGKFNSIALCDIDPFPPAPPEVKEIFVGNGAGQILSVTPEGQTSTFHAYPTPSDPFSPNSVTGLAWHPGENRLYSCVTPSSSDTTRAGRIFVHAADGTPTEFASNAPGGGALNASCLAVSPVDGKLYCGTYGGLIIRWDGPNNGTVVHSATEGGTSVRVWALAFDPSGRIFYTKGGALGGGNAQVRRVLDLTSFETWFTITGAINFRGVSCDNAGRVYVTEQIGDRVYRLFSPSANDPFLSSPWVTFPLTIAVDAQGNVWVAGSDQTLKAFDPNGVPLVPYPIAGSLGVVGSIALRH
jgi:WD40 repeat protein